MTEHEKMGGTYRQAGNYYLPNLEIAEQNETFIGVWGQRHRRYLKESACQKTTQTALFLV